MNDKQIEQWWNELIDVPFYENKKGELLLAYPLYFTKGEKVYGYFPKDTEREEIWQWFDEKYSKGVAYLIYQ